MLTALVVDDDPDIRQLLASMLIRAGLLVRQAANAPEALSALRDDATDVVFTDLAMPGGSGFDLIAGMHADDITIPTIIVSGQSEACGMSLSALAQHLGVVDAVAKPFDREGILVALAKALGPETAL